MIEQILTYIVAPILTALIAWYSSKANTQRNLKSQDLDNEIKSAEYYQGLLDDMSARLTTAVKELMALEERYRDLLKTNTDLIAEMKKYQLSNEDLIDELRKFKQLNGKKL